MTSQSERLNAEPTSVVELRTKMDQGWEPACLFFWGHTPKPNQAHIGRECLSQWYPARFTLDGLDVSCDEAISSAALGRRLLERSVLRDQPHA